jgi:hypothetical protein
LFKSPYFSSFKCSKNKNKNLYFLFFHTIKHIKTAVQVAKNTVRFIKTTIRCNSEEVSLSNHDVARKWGRDFRGREI